MRRTTSISRPPLGILFTPRRVVHPFTIILLALPFVSLNVVAVAADSPDTRENPEHWEAHAAFISLAVLLYLISPGVLVLKRLKVKWWKEAHMGLGALAAALAVVGVALGLWIVERAGVDHFNNTHSFLVALTMALVFAPLVTGLVLQYLKETSRGVRWAHIVLGILGIVAMVIGTVTGLAIS